MSNLPIKLYHIQIGESLQKVIVLNKCRSSVLNINKQHKGQGQHMGLSPINTKIYTNINIHSWKIPSLNLTFRSQVIIWKPKNQQTGSTKKGVLLNKNCRKIIIIKPDLDIHMIHLHTTPSFNSTFCLQDIIQIQRSTFVDRYKRGDLPPPPPQETGN